MRTNEWTRRHRGGFPLFHTPEDVPERATTPALLERVYHAAVATARIIARST
jgi:hypothetical protein